jgi:hypothetical protein
MQRVLMFLLAVSIVAVSGHASAAEKTPVTAVTQIVFAQKLVDALGWGEGLPDKPSERDYLAILGGNRSFKFEAEDVYDRQSDSVVVRDYPLFGVFSGKGWIHASSASPTAAHFRVFIPVSGNYTIKVSAQGDAQLWSIAGKAFRFDSGSKLKESVLGEAFIPAGTLDFNAVIPPGGAIDYIILTAPSYAPVEPLAGWNPPARLTGVALDEITASLLALEPQLPEDKGYGKKIIPAGSVSQAPAGFYVTDNQIMGKTVSPKWLRAGYAPATLLIPLQTESSSVYGIRVHFLGPELTAGFASRTATFKGGSSFGWVDIGTFRLPKGANSLQLSVPPTAGVDVIEVSRKQTSPADYASITGSGRSSDSSIKPEELDSIIKSLQDKFKERR